MTDRSFCIVQNNVLDYGLVVDSSNRTVYPQDDCYTGLIDTSQITMSQTYDSSSSDASLEQSNKTSSICRRCYDKTPPILFNSPYSPSISTQLSPGQIFPSTDTTISEDPYNSCSIPMANQTQVFTPCRELPSPHRFLGFYNNPTDNFVYSTAPFPISGNQCCASSYSYSHPDQYQFSAHFVPTPRAACL